MYQHKTAGKITGVRATGSNILVEMLTAQETFGSPVIVSEKTQPAAPQGYILGIGPVVKAEEWGIKVGDRVLLQGNYVPVPSTGERKVGIVEPHAIKAVLEESSPLED